MAAGTRFNPPPGWLVPPGFTPAAGWQPDPSWPAAPAGWQFWVVDSPDDRTVVSTPTAAAGPQTPAQAAPQTPAQAAPQTPAQAAPLAPPAVPTPQPTGWAPAGGGPGFGGPGFAGPGFAPPRQQAPFYGATQAAQPGSGLAVGIPGLILAVVGLLVVLALQIMIYASTHTSSPGSYSQSFFTAEKVLSWVGVAAFAPATILAAIGARKSRGGVALAALIVCGLAAAIYSVPVW
jgi:hypothetical protein